MAGELLFGEFTLEKTLENNDCNFIIPGNPNILCTPLPSHWRSNKALLSTFKVFILTPILDGTKVSLAAGNNENINAELKGNQSMIRNQIAIFQDLRFLGKSGRGKRFNITITVESQPPLVSVYANAIKVTVDGPREPRTKTNGSGNISVNSEHSKKVFCKFPTYISPLFDRNILRNALNKTRKLRKKSLKNLYGISDSDVDVYVKKIYAKYRSQLRQEKVLKTSPLKEEPNHDNSDIKLIGITQCGTIHLISINESSSMNQPGDKSSEHLLDQLQSSFQSSKSLE